MCKRITIFAIITLALFICIPSFAQHFLGAFSGSALQVDTQVESPAQNNNTQTLPEQKASDTIQFQLFVPAGGGQSTNGYTVELDLPGKTFSSYIGTVSGRDWTGAALVSRGSKELSALFVTGATVPSTGYLGQVELQVTQPLEDGATLIVKSMSLTSGRDVDQLDVSNAVISFTATSASMCPGDFDGNGSVDIADFLSFVDVYGSSSSDANYNAQMDLDSNGSVDIADFLSFVDVYGTKCGDGGGSGGSGSGDSGGDGGGSGGSGSGGGSGDRVLVTGITRLTSGDPSLSQSNTSPIWSPDGRFIAFLSRWAGGSPNAYDRIDRDGGNRIQLTDIGSTGVSGMRPAWSPDGRFIAFMAAHNSYDIYRVDSDGSNEIQLTFNPAEEHAPSWSPDSRFITFSSNRDGVHSIYRVASDGSNLTRLTDGERRGCGYPLWSPDGRFIAFIAFPSITKYAIYRIDSDGSNEIRLTSTPVHHFNQRWSPDGRYIVFESYRGDGEYDIYRIDSDGSNEIQLTSNPARDDSPTWSPDGRFIAFRSNRDGRYCIYVVASDGSNLIRLTNIDFSDHNPAWSPDGRSIAFDSYRNDTYDIYRMDIEYGSIDRNQTILIIPDAGLAAVLANSLDKAAKTASVTVGEVATLQTLSGQNSDIRDLTGLEYATNLTELNLQGNFISDLTPLTGLTNLTRLLLGGNRILDIAPLVANTGLGSGDYVDLRGNTLNDTSRNTHIPALRARGVRVLF